MNQNVRNCIKNRLGVLLSNTNYPDLEPNLSQLQEMQISKKRFTQIKLNRGSELLYSEAVNISEWLKGLIPDIKPWHLFDHPTNEQLEQLKTNIEKTSFFRISGDCVGDAGFVYSEQRGGSPSPYFLQPLLLFF